MHRITGAVICMLAKLRPYAVDAWFNAVCVTGGTAQSNNSGPSVQGTSSSATVPSMQYQPQQGERSGLLSPY